MNWKTLLLCTALTSALAGCPGGDPPPVVEEEETHYYVLSGGDIPEPGADNLTAGFNLDGMISDGSGDTCQTEQVDFVSIVSGAEGVDNQLAGVVGLLADMIDGGIAGALLEQIANGTFILVMEVTSNGIANDDSAEVHLFLANRPGPACDNAAMMCPANSICPEDATAAEPSNCGPLTDSSGVIQAGQTFTVATELGRVPATIVDGYLLVEVDELPLRIAIDGTMIELSLLNARIGGDLSAASIDNGEIGAEVTVANIVEVAAAAGLEVTEDTIRGIAYPDLMVSATDPSICNSISAGLTYSAVAATGPES